MWEKNIDLFRPSYIWPNPAFHFRLYYESEKCRVFIIENIAHNWIWLKKYRGKFRETDYFFVSLGWYFDNHLVSECDHIFQILGLRKDRFFFMYNDYADKSLFDYYGFEGRIINQNCFLDENLFSIKDNEKIYDAIYTARRASFKRHHLASQVKNLALIAGSNHGGEIVNLPEHVYLNEVQLEPEEVIVKLSESSVGLILSEFEGACYSSSEYLLCGLPVVSTESKGGRNIWYNSYNSIICESNPEAVAQAVSKLKSYQRDPFVIRDMHIRLANYFRSEFIELHQDILKKANDNSSAHDWFRGNFMHKLLVSDTPNFEKLFDA